MTCASGLTSRTFWKHSGVDESGGEKEEGQKRLSPDYLSNTPPLPITPFHFPQPPVTFVIQDVGMTLRHSIWSTKATKASQTMKNCGFARFTRDLCFAAVLVLTTTWNDLFCSCVDNVITLRQLFTFFYLSPNHFYAKLERHFTIVSYTNMAFSSREWKPRIDFVIEPCTYFLTLKTVP